MDGPAAASVAGFVLTAGASAAPVAEHGEEEHWRLCGPCRDIVRSFFPLHSNVGPLPENKNISCTVKGECESVGEACRLQQFISNARRDSFRYLKIFMYS